MLAIRNSGKLQDLMTQMPSMGQQGQMKLSDLANPMALSGALQQPQSQGLIPQGMPQGIPQQNVIEQLMQQNNVNQNPPPMPTAMQRIQGVQFGNQWKY